ncbi:MAG: nicotinate (nicotinamide) nucleotide adenylyltransferase [Firmicutes bacterium]|nr:nicotinate (nicotinamide) nucleotide adenylyltransferase [Bacillota bacterium]HOB35092.1 nicotinate (nicotinamide) nucleotide adenylyltransferase [Bacillota bacterium]HPZ90594.1 nicotinate (nicotinamide) nucleotide adenylyltransferase [Bacillota bacterium]HQE02212.1 nicotinate (nicotinamide) nucleotide adenylyltransferase [Bacillota bacterium]
MNKRILLFGGSFDPPHIGHLLVAQWVAEEFACPVRFLPNGNPPHKNSLSAPRHRAEMVRLAIAGNSAFSLDTSELEAGAVYYTVDTLRRYQREYGCSREQLLFVLGSDALDALDTWRDPCDIVRLCTLVVCRRSSAARPDLSRLQAMGARVVMCHAPVVEISSTDIRNRVRQGRSIRYYVPDAVLDYIDRHGLYLEGKCSPDVER